MRASYGDRRPGRQVGGIMWRRDADGSWRTDAIGHEFSPNPDTLVRCERSMPAELLPVRPGRGGRSGPVSWDLVVDHVVVGGSFPMRDLSRAMGEARRVIARRVIAEGKAS